MDVFISHSARDTDLASAFVDLLRSALSLPPEKIRCTSVDGYRLEGGADTDAVLRREVFEAEAFVGLLTPTSITSPYVLFELGARWGAERSTVPLLARGATPAMIPGPLARTNALQATAASQIHQLIEELAAQLDVRAASPSSFQGQLDRCLAEANRPDDGVLAALSAAEPRLDPKRLKAAFTAGAALGTKTMLLPIGPTESEQLGEFLATLDVLQINGPISGELRRYLDPDYLDMSLLGRGADPAVPETSVAAARMERLLALLRDVDDEVAAGLSPAETSWCKLGTALYELSAGGILRDADAGDEAHVREISALTLEILLDDLDAPQTLMNSLRSVVSLARSDADAVTIYAEVHRLSAAIHSAL